MHNFHLKRYAAIAASALLISTAVPRRAEANPAALPGAAACIASVTCVVAVVVVGGIAYWVITHQGQRPQRLEIGPVMPIIDNPDANVESWDEEVWASNTRVANQKCQAIVEAMIRSGQVARVAREARSVGPGRFICKIEVEV